MFNKFIPTVSTVATVATTILSFSAISVLAAPSKVHVVKNCMAYDQQGNAVMSLKIGDYYPAPNRMTFPNGTLGVTVITERGRLNFPAHCLESSQGVFIQYQ